MARIPIEKQELKKAELWRDEDTGQYFFRLEYLCEDDAEVYRLIFPKVETGIPLIQPRIASDYSMFPGRDIAKIAFHLCNEEGHIAYPDENGNWLYRETVSVKTHEMTMEEIEKKLGVDACRKDSSVRRGKGCFGIADQKPGKIRKLQEVGG